MLSRVARVVVILAVLGVGGYYVRHVEWHGVLEAARHASILWLVFAALLNLPLVWSKAVRLRLLSPVPLPSTRRLMDYFFVSYAADNLFVSQAGPAVRAALLARDGLPLSTALAVQVLEKIIEAIGLGLVVAPLALLSPETPFAVRLVHAGFILALVTLLLAVVWLGVVSRQPDDGSHAPAPSLFGRIQQAARPLLDRRRLALVVLYTAIGWVLEVVMVIAVLEAVKLHVPFIAAAALIVLGVNFAALVPGLPANLGPFEASCVVVLAVFAIPHAPALSFALLYHLLHTIPVTILGLPGFLRRRSVNKTAQG